MVVFYVGAALLALVTGLAGVYIGSRAANRHQMSFLIDLDGAPELIVGTLLYIGESYYPPKLVATVMGEPNMKAAYRKVEVRQKGKNETTTFLWPALLRTTPRSFMINEEVTAVVDLVNHTGEGMPVGYLLSATQADEWLLTLMPEDH